MPLFQSQINMTCTLPFLDKKKQWLSSSIFTFGGKYSRSVCNYVNRLSVKIPFLPPCPSVSICLRCPKEHLQTAIRSYPDCDFNLRREATSRSVRPVCARPPNVSDRIEEHLSFDSSRQGQLPRIKYLWSKHFIKV